MPMWWEYLLGVAALVLLLVLAYGIGLSVRRRYLERNGGTFELSHRVRDTRPGRGWVLGLGRYVSITDPDSSKDARDELEWFRVFSLSLKPKRSWNRTEIAYVASRSPEGVEDLVLYPDQRVVTCEVRGHKIELAMSERSLIGFQAWLESRRPQRDHKVL